MKVFSTLLLLVSISSAFGAAPAAFPTGPVPETTPGDICQHADEIRYPERIVYCRRAVPSSRKDAVIDMYDQKFGFKIRETGRGAFKIDHYIPLCMGGSNEVQNLWPQHKSVYELTDPVEGVACQKMSEGKLLQARAIELIRQAKANPPQAYLIVSELNKL